MSKGHACSAVYAALAETGFFDVNELNTWCQDGSRLSGHITYKNVPGVEFSTGSLGHGCCVAAGMALNAKLKNEEYRTFVIVGDGECDEGSVWEMAIFAHQYKLDNLIVIVDHNKMQAMGYCEEVAAHIDLADKWKAFGWDVMEIDGHNHAQIRDALGKRGNGKPLCVIAHTIKGKGVSLWKIICCGIIETRREKITKERCGNWRYYSEEGICEQNMASTAAGIAMEGNIVFMYSIGNFPTLRCLEQIRNDIAYHNANVKIVAVGAGFSYGNLGMSHHATEDIAVMRAIPGMTIFSPADANETAEAVKVAAEIDGPVYIRLGRGGEPDIGHIFSDINRIIPIKVNEYRNEKYLVALLGIGIVMSDVIKAAKQLEAFINVSVYSVPKIKPLDVEGILKLCEENDYVITVEEHNIVGGFGAAVAEIIAENDVRAKLVRIGMNDRFAQVVGSPSYLRHYYGLDCCGIVKKIEDLVGIKND